MSDIPSFPYEMLWHERQIVSVANLTRSDGIEFLEVARGWNLKPTITMYPLQHANDALDDLRTGRLQGAAVIIP
jgi:propanol-preferring alcohol dehydrogenase